jgi:hypothetical protein
MSGIFAAMGVETAVLSRRFRLFALAALVGAALVALTVAFLAFAAYLALLSQIAPWQAALAVAGGALVVGAILLIVAVKALTRATEQIEAAVKTNMLVRAAPLAARLATGNPRLLMGLAAAAAALVALLRALSAKPKAEG